MIRNWAKWKKDYFGEGVDSGFVSSIGQYVVEFEAQIKTYIDAAYAVATVNERVHFVWYC